MLNFPIDSLYSYEGLSSLHERFCQFLLGSNKELYFQLKQADKYDANLTLELAPYIEDFIVSLFKIEKESQELYKKNKSCGSIHKCKRQFIQRHALKLYDSNQNFPKIESQLKRILNTDNITEKLYADTVMDWWVEQDNYFYELEIAARYAAWMVKNSRNSVLFNLPKKLDYENLINVISSDEESVLKSRATNDRIGFKLTDKGLTTVEASDNAHYCIFCHKQEKDSCSKGLLTKDGSYKISPTNVRLEGCPLDQKISEMNLLKSQGHNIAALAVITLDNPMCGATGHRICNDCMRSCIYQKQTPVNIPGVETNILAEVLALPYGFEIYSLLTRWNPLNFTNPIPKKNTNYKVLVVGLGPAGFTMAHYLLNEGHAVAAIDGLKIEPLPQDIVGKNFKPIKDISKLYEELDERIISGFGGVSEYGITVRWNKNYLKVIRIILERRTNFAMYGGVRFGSNITYQGAMKLGFQHLVLAIGAGSPNIINIKNNLIKRVRMASDFLMSLQLGGAYKTDSLTNLQIRMPIVVIGGGLTAIDTATEAQQYYAVQVEKFAFRYKKLINRYGKSYVESSWTIEDQEVAQEFLQHAEFLSKALNKLAVLKQLGGVKVLYRKSLRESPAYRLNHEEMEKAFAEGVKFVEHFIPTEVYPDQFNGSAAIRGYIRQEEKVIKAKTILIAAGTNPNSVLSKEDPDHFSDFIDDPPSDVTIVGDVNPKYSGSVVRAIASSKDSYPIITQKLMKLNPLENLRFFRDVDNALSATILDVIQLTPTIYEIIVLSPLAAKNFSPGQFYRFQNYENNKKLVMEPIALTGAKVDKDMISLIILDMGGSSSLCKYLREGEKVVLMGPTGSPTEIPQNETVMLIGGGLGNAVLFSIGKAMRKNGCRVLYFAGYKKGEDRYKIEELEKTADVIVWACDEKVLTKNRKQDFSFQGNIINVVTSYQSAQAKKVRLEDVSRVLAIGSDSMMNAVNLARSTTWKEFLREDVKLIASINSPMQCMMKEICAQCLQKQIDPETKKERFVYSCSSQDQDMKKVDFSYLTQRLKQNSVQEKLTNMWIKFKQFSYSK